MNHSKNTKTKLKLKVGETGAGDIKLSIDIRPCTLVHNFYIFFLKFYPPVESMREIFYKLWFLIVDLL